MAGTVTHGTTTTYLTSYLTRLRRREYHIAFRTPDGVLQETTTKVGGGPPAKADTPITVAYDPDSPSHARIRQGTSWGTIVLWGGLGILVLYVGLSTIAFHVRRMVRTHAPDARH